MSFLLKPIRQIPNSFAKSTAKEEQAETAIIIGIFAKKNDLNDPKVHQKIIDEFVEYFKKESIQLLGIVKSPTLGKSGNQEYLVYLDFNYEK